MDYLDFELEIATGNGSEYPVAVVHSVAGEAHETMHFPFDQQALANQLSTLQIAISGEMPPPPPLTREQIVLSFGQALFNALFTGEVLILYEVSRSEAGGQDKGLRVKLRIQPAELVALPWEFLYDPNHAGYLCLSDYTPVMRYLELPEPTPPLAVTPPLSLLGMTASPKDLDDLDVEREKQRIETALAELQTKGLVRLTWLPGHTWEDLQQAMLEGPWHIFHFIGHGGFNPDTNEGVIALEDHAGQSHFLSATQLGLLLTDHHPLRLVVLNSCKGASSSVRDIFSSTAAALVRRGIPAVLANQYVITDQAALELSRVFYTALAAGKPIDTAVGEARKAISLGVTNTVEWGTPVLHMRAPDGILFTLPASPNAHQDRYIQATSGTPIFADPLIDNSRGYGWNVGSGYCTFVGGSLHAKRPSPGALNCDATGARSFGNSAFQAQMTIMSGDAGGIDFRINPASNYDGYFFSIGQDGSYRLYRSVNFSLQLVTSGTSSAVHTGLSQTNLITVIAQGGTFDLYVNAQYITTVTDNTFSQGVIGVFAENQRNSTEVIFNNVKVWAL